MTRLAQAKQTSAAVASVDPYRQATAGRLLGASAALADDATAFTFGLTTPNTDLLAPGQSVLQTCHPHTTLAADLLGKIGLIILIGIKDARIEPPACPQHAPFDVMYRHVSPRKRVVVTEG